MPKRSPELKALEVKRLFKPGRHAVGGVQGLYLNVTDTGARSWILRVIVNGSRRHIGLGAFDDVSLAEARDLAREMRKKIISGIDPVAERKAALARAEHRRGLSFSDAFERYFADKLESELSNPKHREQWRSTLTTYAYPVIGNKSVDLITVEDVLAVLKPIWTTKTETATRVRQRIERVLDWSAAMGHRSGVNPALWKGSLQQMLPAPTKVKVVVNHPAVAIDEVVRWFAVLQTRDGIAARALTFLTLNASRSQEIRKARWEEISFETATWLIPAEHMKMKEPHRVPLSARAINLLRQAPRFAGCPLLFPSLRGGEMSDATLSAVMKRMHNAEVDCGRKGFLDPVSKRPAVPHGLRSTFRDWVAERTDHPREMAEIALAHEMGSEVERAYRRGDMLEKRRRMMEDWANFISGRNQA
ncbi:site-specific integrase [Thalassococcus profundi]|uniref:Site-specific integrase n=1 Tax=Thalassococcus profundi TaxID=2282382 RepID=A0A369TPG3_9RHOB|nr:site-specific integrase [Thalassococcus profundi]RDD67181.1 site-specific integrase [Thalassococcus profundi]